jgi:hypothetical protein
MSAITIGFSTSSSIISRIIRWFTRSKASHAFATFYDQTLERIIIIEATGSGYRLTQHEKWSKGNKVIGEFKCKKDLTKSLRFMAEKLGNNYDYWSALGLAVRRWWGKWYRNPLRDPNKLHCSEAITLMLQHAGLAETLDPESTTPEDLLQYCKDSELFEEM